MIYGLSPDEFTLLEKLAITPLKIAGAKVWIFGSRARGDHSKFSDTDLLFEFDPAPEPPRGLIGKINEDLENSNLSVKVDLVNAQELAESYRESVLKDRILL